MSKDANEIMLRYYGHSAFRWRTPRGVGILIDPFRNPQEMERRRWFLRPFPSVEADIVLVSHPHFDHDAFEMVLGCPTIIRTPGEFRGGDFIIEAIPDQHAGEYGLYFNLIFIVRVAGVSFCHMGDNRADIPQDVRGQIGRVDVLMIPIDGSHHILTFDEVNKVIELLDPRIVLPIHYLIPGLTSPDSTLETRELWLEKQGRAVRIAGEEARISQGSIPDSREVWFFEGYARE